MEIKIEAKNYLGLVYALTHTLEQVVTMKPNIITQGCGYEIEQSLFKLTFSINQLPDGFDVNAPLGTNFEKPPEEKSARKRKRKVADVTSN